MPNAYASIGAYASEYARGFSPEWLPAEASDWEPVFFLGSAHGESVWQFAAESAEYIDNSISISSSNIPGFWIKSYAEDIIGGSSKSDFVG